MRLPALDFGLCHLPLAIGYRLSALDLGLWTLHLPWRLENPVEWALQGYGRGGKRSLDEEKICIRDGELFG